VWVLRLFLRHICAAFCAAFQCSLEMLIGHLKIMLPRDLWTVPNPLANNVSRERLLEFRLPARSQVVEDSRPWFHAGSLHKPRHVCAEI
jgi:hypothetical protein